MSNPINRRTLAAKLTPQKPTDIHEGRFNFPTWRDNNSFISLADFPSYIPEKHNPNVLIRGRWLERGGSAWLISTAGTGKSIWLTQFALCATAGIPFSGLTPNRPLNIWVFQSEDSPTRITIDREDILAELRETRPDIPWDEIARRVMFFRTTGDNGVQFLQRLAAFLDKAQAAHALPDIIIFNPFFAFIGGAINDSACVSPFLRGGMIGRDHTDGLQKIMEDYGIGAMFAHHTPKPPTNKELDAWMNTPFPEYLGAGSSEITNWGRSFITMMKVKGTSDKVCLTAGKNGAGLGWRDAGGMRRLYLAWSDGESIDGEHQRRHAWRELTPDEMAEVSKELGDQVEADARKLAELLRETPKLKSQLKLAVVFPRQLSRIRQREALKKIEDNPSDYGLAIVPWRVGKIGGAYVGTPEAAAREAEIEVKNRS